MTKFSAFDDAELDLVERLFTEYGERPVPSFRQEVFPDVAGDMKLIHRMRCHLKMERTVRQMAAERALR